MIQDKNFFFEKKKQETFDRCRGPVPSEHLKTQRFFGSFVQKRTFFACLLSLTPVLAHADDPVVAERAGDHITVSQARVLLGSLDPDARKKLEAGSAVSDLLRNLLLQRAVLQEAEAQKWQDRPEVAALLQRARDQLVSQSFLAAQATLPAGYPSDAEIQAAYEQNKPKLMRPRGYQLSEIFLPGTAADQPRPAPPASRSGAARVTQARWPGRCRVIAEFETGRSRLDRRDAVAARREGRHRRIAGRGGQRPGLSAGRVPSAAPGGHPPCRPCTARASAGTR